MVVTKKQFQTLKLRAIDDIGLWNDIPNMEYRKTNDVIPQKKVVLSKNF